MPSLSSLAIPVPGSGQPSASPVAEESPCATPSGLEDSGDLVKQLQEKERRIQYLELKIQQLSQVVNNKISLYKRYLITILTGFRDNIS